MPSMTKVNQRLSSKDNVRRTLVPSNMNSFRLPSESTVTMTTTTVTTTTMTTAILAMNLIFLVTSPFFVEAGVITKTESINSPHEHKLSEKEHYGGSEDHNADYDHDAFLGRDAAQTFDELSPEESQERLGKIVDKIDKDGDGKVTNKELREWIQFVQKRYVTEDVERQWVSHERNGDGQLTWKEYYNITYGFVNPIELETDNLANGHNSYSEIIERDENRFTAADKDKSGFLNKDEFLDFLHPEDGGPHMRDVVIHETIADIDKDGDGMVNMEEYLADLWTGGETGEKEPEWVEEERKQFKEFRDRNGDGKLDRQEVEEWILPQDFDHSDVETRHLIGEADQNSDGFLTKEEIVEKHDLFVGSQATDFGDILLRHDEF